MASLVAVGDIMLGRGVSESCVDYDLLFSSEVKQLLHGRLVIGNLECVLGRVGEKNELSHSHFSADVSEAYKVLKYFDVLNLANNHIFDFKDSGVSATLKALADYGIASIGIGKTADEANTPYYVEIDGVQVAIFGTTSVANPHTGKREYVLSRPDEELYEAIKVARAEGRIVIVSFHGGGGDCKHPSPGTRIVFNELFESGAALVLGHHPHVIQGYTKTQDSVGFYSLGDFVFDKLHEGRDRSILVRFEDLRQFSKFQVFPMQRGPDLGVRALTGAEKEEALEHILLLSQQIATSESDRLYQKWHGNPLIRILKNLKSEFSRGGVSSIIKKIIRLDSVKMKMLLSSLGVIKSK